VIGLGTKGSASRRAVDRRADRLVAVSTVVIALAFLAAAVLATFLPADQRVGLWLPLHLALAGAASTIIAGVMPFFSAAIGAAQPVDARLRWTSVLLVAGGAALVTVGYTRGADAVAVLGGLAFIGGSLTVGYATVAPWRRGLGPRGGIVALGYGAAVVMVVIGALLGTLYLAGVEVVLEAWARLRPAHAWLNLAGFVSLIIATTLLHFFPTVVGARIQRVPAAYLTVTGLAAGAFTVALGFAAGLDLLVRAGAVLVAAGAAGLTLYAVLVWRTRNAWHTDPGWHAFAIGGLVSAIAWFDLGVLLSAGRLLAEGATPAAVDASLLAGPFVAGWLGLAILASATHLVPAIGPGDAAAHTAQRRLLGRGWLPRLAGLDAGVAMLTIGLATGLEAATTVGLVLFGLVLAATAAILLAAVAIGIRSARPA
jgi:hypothetical protein